MTKVALYAIGSSTTLESNKSLAILPSEGAGLLEAVNEGFAQLAH